ncbi:MAG: hypothetical protein QXQ14_00405 [Candidatus Aenigmatarchaeota archaeon]
MKSQSEIFWIGFSTVVFSIIIILLLNYSAQLTRKSYEVFMFSTFDDLALKSLSGFYISKLPILEKTYLQIAIDALVTLRRYKESERERVKKELHLGELVYYGIALGTYNASDFIYSNFDNYFGKGRWQLIIYYDKNLYQIYGYEIKSENIKSYVLTIPIPDQEVGYIILRVA